MFLRLTLGLHTLAKQVAFVHFVQLRCALFDELFDDGRIILLALTFTEDEVVVDFQGVVASYT